MFGWEFPPHNSGGLGVACFGLVRALGRLGAHVSFVLPKRVPVSSDYARMLFGDDYFQFLKFLEVDSPLTPYLTSKEYEERYGELDLKHRNIYGRGLFEEVERYGLRGWVIGKSIDHDVIHAHDWLSFKAGMLAKRASGKPLVVHVHATEYDRTGGQNLNQRVYDREREGMEAADRVITVSQFTKDIVVRHYGIPAEKVSVVHNGIDEEDYVNFGNFSVPFFEGLKKRGAKIVLFAGRITIQKGPDYFLKLAKRVLELDPKVEDVMLYSKSSHEAIY